MKVGRAILSDAVFEGPVDFTSADITSFEAQWAKFQNKENKAIFSGMKVGDFAFFHEAVFEGPVDLSYADFGALILVNTVWPKVAAQFHMQGMSYKYIRAVLLTLADQSAYSADVYSKLEEFFLRQGYRGRCRQSIHCRKSSGARRILSQR